MQGALLALQNKVAKPTILVLIILTMVSPLAAFAAPGDSMPELDEDFESSDGAEVDDEGSLETYEPIPQDEIDNINEQYQHEIENCDGDQACTDRAEQMRDASMQEAQESADGQRGGAYAPSTDQSTTVTEITETEAEIRARLDRENMRPEEIFAEDCYGYPYGDSQDSSDFALKIDCILKTSNQNLSFFTNEASSGGPAPIEKVVIKIINTLIAIIGSVSMLLIVIAGFMMITSPGNENQRSKATEILTSAIISLVVAFSSYIIVNAVVGLFF